jgi:hypothetical protein
MPTDNDLDRQIGNWLEGKAPNRLPDRVLLATFERTRQRRQYGGWRAHLRRLHVNHFFGALAGVTAAAAIALVAVFAAGGIYFNQPSTGGASPQPALTETFTSAINGMSVSYPSGWHLEPATESWNGDEFVQQNSLFADVIYEKETDSPFIALASMPLAGRSFDEWSSAYLAKVTADDPSCTGTRDPITVDGAAGVLSDPCLMALVSDGQRGYFIWLYRSDDRAWFERILSTVKLHAAEAVDAPSPLPSAAPSGSGSPQPALTETFTSAINGMSVSYPSGWHLQPATESWNGDDLVQQNSPFTDVIYESETDSPFIALASTPLAGRSVDDWSNAYIMKIVADDAACATTRDKITVDGALGVQTSPCLHALVSDGQRGYLVWLFRSDDRAWFDQILSTIKFHPADEVGSPTPSVTPASTE